MFVCACVCHGCIIVVIAVPQSTIPDIMVSLITVLGMVWIALHVVAICKRKAGVLRQVVVVMMNKPPAAKTAA